MFHDGEESIKVKFLTAYETDNGLELDDPEYEEYYGIAFVIVETGKCFEINHACLPESVFCDGEKVY